MTQPIVYRVELELTEPMYMGGERIGNTLYLLRAVVLKTPGGEKLETVIIPRSSVKGLLRSLAERIAHAYYGGREGLHARLACLHHQVTPGEAYERRRGYLRSSPLHTPLGRRLADVFREESFRGEGFELRYASPSFDEELAELLREYLRCMPASRLRRLAEPLSEKRDRLYEELASLLCPVCTLFGSPLLGGALRATDLVPERLGEPLVGFRSHVGIERARRVRKANMLYKLEYLAPGSRLHGYLVVAPPTTLYQLDECGKLRGLVQEAWREAQKLLEMVEVYAREVEVLVGGHRSRGYGYAILRLARLGTDGHKTL